MYNDKTDYKQDTWVVYAAIPRSLFQEVKEAGLVPQIHMIVEDALREAVNTQNRRKKHYD